MHWSNYLETECPVFSDYGDRYGFYGLHELAIEIIEQADCDLDPEELPRHFFECDQTLLGADVSNIARQLFKGKCPVTIVEWLIENLYDMSELDYPDYRDLIGFKEFESEMLHFISINYLIWMICGKFQIFKPWIHSIGLKNLKAAIDKFSKDNQYAGLWNPDYKRPIELGQDFWRIEIFPQIRDQS